MSHSARSGSSTGTFVSKLNDMAARATMVGMSLDRQLNASIAIIRTENYRSGGPREMRLRQALVDPGKARAQIAPHLPTIRTTLGDGIGHDLSLSFQFRSSAAAKHKKPVLANMLSRLAL